jgi:hypothetical protein
MTMGYTQVEAENEFYRRLLVNLAQLYKTKGTRKAIEFLLKFLGAPEPMITINEYVYRVTDVPASADLEGDIYDAIQQGRTTFTREGYPVDEVTGLPRRALDPISDVFFQKGAGWYEKTLDHGSRLILDEDLSVLTGRTKVIKTKNLDFTYGEEYFDVYRLLPGLYEGYTLESEIDNVKAQLEDANSPYVLNRKNVEVYLSPVAALEYDIFAKSAQLSTQLGFNVGAYVTGATFEEFLDFTLNQIVGSSIPPPATDFTTAIQIYNAYTGSTSFTPFTLEIVNNFIEQVASKWTKLIDQFIPATTLWTCTNLIENSIFNRSQCEYVP